MVVEDCKSYKEAIEKSGLSVGQPAVISRLQTHPNTNGVWVVIPEFEVVKPAGAEDA